MLKIIDNIEIKSVSLSENTEKRAQIRTISVIMTPNEHSF
jgi:hypothetical protein